MMEMTELYLKLQPNVMLMRPILLQPKRLQKKSPPKRHRLRKKAKPPRQLRNLRTRLFLKLPLMEKPKRFRKKNLKKKLQPKKLGKKHTKYSLNTCFWERMNGSNNTSFFVRFHEIFVTKMFSVICEPELTM